MWRAIAVVSCVLSGCATAPEPVHVEKEKPPSCGGVIPPRMPETLVAEATENARQTCVPGAVAGARNGEVRVVVRQGLHTPPQVDTESTGDLNEDDLNCVRSATNRVLEFLREEGADYIGQAVVTFSVAFEPPRPAPPPGPGPEL